ncbi:TetR/AcrR family transcriptional regulator [Mycobacterium sp. 94-17]|uniref:TetR/AcrR family transcriptional regulator n=1 Tax=Mycobacterium sp. 94-17 TaxID=2986147 RepID=UPI002D1E5EFE|nr:TetR/AcrR family transcriptional regulator [Mycobacterium sp. 94-17]MEB4209778.1 TetR/AcrR family transcriptional regulator [Mycobacterium sp. 94-17]
MQSEPGARDGDTRRRVLDAAVACILEKGLYRASSNAIAERAALTWGAIQHYYGTREALMLAVLEDANRRFDQHLKATSVVGATLEDRITALSDILDRHYGTPEYLAMTQLVLNLTHDPNTAQRANAALAEASESASPELQRLIDEVLAGTGLDQADVGDVLFHGLRGLALSQTMVEGTAVGVDKTVPATRARHMVRALTLLLTERATAAPAGADPARTAAT